MTTKTRRRVKLQGKYRPMENGHYYKEVPWLTISGIWLEQAGLTLVSTWRSKLKTTSLSSPAAHPMEITEIKAELTLARVLQHYGLKPDKHLRLHCPFHADKTPSLQVYYKTHTAYCFSSNCKTHGKSLDVIDFVMYRENCKIHDPILFNG